jgi:NitT/TauT family transport system substrate-binding protein
MMKHRGFCTSLGMVSATTVITALAAGCTGGSSGSTLASSLVKVEKPDIVVAAVPSVSLAGLFIAEDQGLFARQGLHVKIVPIASSAAVIADQLKGNIDISGGNYVSYIEADAIQGAKLRVIAEASTLHPGSHMLITAPGSRITSIAGLIHKRIGVNARADIGTLLVSALLEEHGISPGQVTFVTDKPGFPKMPADLAAGDYDAAFLAEPYATIAEEKYGEQVLADLDQGATSNFDIDGYIVTQKWEQEYPKTADAFLRAVEEGQQIATTDRTADELAMHKFDKLSSMVTSVMALTGYPTGQIDEVRLQQVASEMLQFGILGQQYTAEVQDGALIRSMIGSG